jgi:purine-nucleoside phosphorylase
MSPKSNIASNIERIKSKAGDKPIEIAFILGSGLGDLSKMVSNPVVISYDQLEGFPHAGVSGHNPSLTIGDLEGVRVAILGGRAHYYETGNAQAMFPALKTLNGLGIKTLLVTNSAGSVNSDFQPGDLMILNDHINFTGLNPLIGVEGDERFVDLSNAYDADLRAKIKTAATSQGIKLGEGVYTWFSGPSFETQAEISMVKNWGTDAVGMSTVPEVIMARYLKIKCIAISNITNMAAGMSEENLSHEHTKAMAGTGAAKLEKIIKTFLELYKS